MLISQLWQIIMGPWQPQFSQQLFKNIAIRLVQMHRIVYQIIINSMYTNHPLPNQQIPSFVNSSIPIQYPQFTPLPNHPYQTPYHPQFGVYNQPHNNQPLPFMQSTFNTPSQFPQFQPQSHLGLQPQTPLQLQPQTPLQLQPGTSPQIAGNQIPASNAVAVNQKNHQGAIKQRVQPLRKEEGLQKMMECMESVEQVSCQFEQQVPVSKEKFNNSYFKIIKEMQQNAKNQKKKYSDDNSMDSPHPRIGPHASVNEMRYFWEQRYFELQVKMEYIAFCIETVYNMHNELDDDANNAYLAQVVIDTNFTEGSRKINKYLQKVHNEFRQSMKVHDHVFKLISPQTLEYFNALSMKKFSIGCLGSVDISEVKMESEKEQIQIPAFFIEDQKQIDQANEVTYFKNKYTAALEKITRIEEQVNFYKDQHKRQMKKINDIGNLNKELTVKVNSLTQKCQSLKQNEKKSNQKLQPQSYENQTDHIFKQIYLTLQSVNSNCGYISSKICRLQQVQIKSQISLADLLKSEDKNKLCQQCSKAQGQNNKKQQDSLFEVQKNEELLQMCHKHNAYKQKVESSLKEAKEKINELNPLISSLEIDRQVASKISSLIAEGSKKIDQLF